MHMHIEDKKKKRKYMKWLNGMKWPMWLESEEYNKSKFQKCISGSINLSNTRTCKPTSNIMKLFNE